MRSSHRVVHSLHILSYWWASASMGSAGLPTGASEPSCANSPCETAASYDRTRRLSVLVDKDEREMGTSLGTWGTEGLYAGMAESLRACICSCVSLGSLRDM